MEVKKQRLDVYLAEKGMTKSRSEARALIKSESVYVNNKSVLKPGELVSGDENIEIIGERCAYVSRGGLKLEKAMEKFDIDLGAKVCMDIGASTGGFTDCMLKNGAKKVYAVDVGRDQLDKTLAEDKRVINMEQTNIRHIDRELLDDEIDFFSVDVSFISLTRVLPTVFEITKPNACGVCLIKPQFEAGRENIGKKGVVRSADVHKRVICEIVDFSTANGFEVLGLDYSPIKGPEGNIEYLIFLTKNKDKKTNIESLNIEKVVSLSHSGAN